MMVTRHVVGKAMGLGLVVCLVGVSYAAAEAPATINIQGQLFDGDGFALTGLRDYTLRFFDAEADGAQLGGVLTGSVSLSAEGIFNISLTVPEAVLSSTGAWYEISVDSDATPDGVDANDLFPARVKVESVPFALQASEAEHVDALSVGLGNVDDAEFDALDGVTGSIQTQLDAKPVNADVYTRTEIDMSQTDQDTVIGQNTTDIATNASDVEVNTSDIASNGVDIAANTSGLSTNTDDIATNVTDIAKKLTFAWEVTSSSSVQAVPNRGYMANDVSPVTITLPLSADFSVGDTLRVSGLGSGGWKLAQNDGQEISIRSLEIPDYSAAWTARDSERGWRAVASSSDGTKLLACD